jgi:hypothetical protein
VQALIAKPISRRITFDKIAGFFAGSGSRLQLGRPGSVVRRHGDSGGSHRQLTVNLGTVVAATVNFRQLTVNLGTVVAATIKANKDQLSTSRPH